MDEINEIEYIHLMPIGSIVAWVIKPSKESENQTFLPDGWMRCDGYTIPPPSIWAGSVTPDLNGKKHFLRGGSDSEYLETEEDQIQDLQLSINDPGHHHTEGGHSHGPISDRYLYDSEVYCHDQFSSDSDATSHTDYWPCFYNEWNENWWSYAQHTISTEHITIDDAHTSISLELSDYRRGTETRPVNTKVIWIMRVW